MARTAAFGFGVVNGFYCFRAPSRAPFADSCKGSFTGPGYRHTEGGAKLHHVVLDPTPHSRGGGGGRIASPSVYSGIRDDVDSGLLRFDC